jgi:hypothetical protein
MNDSREPRCKYLVSTEIFLVMFGFGYLSRAKSNKEKKMEQRKCIWPPSMNARVLIANSILLPFKGDMNATGKVDIEEQEKKALFFLRSKLIAKRARGS